MLSGFLEVFLGCLGGALEVAWGTLGVDLGCHMGALKCHWGTLRCHGSAFGLP